MGHGKAEAGKIIRGSVHSFFSHVIQLGVAQAGDKQWAEGMLANVLYGGIQPRLNLHGFGHGHCFVLHRLAQGQGNAGSGLSQVFTEDEYGVVLFDLTHRGDRQRAVAQDLQH